jgi:hypothetical protein
MKNLPLFSNHPEKRGRKMLKKVIYCLQIFVYTYIKQLRRYLYFRRVIKMKIMLDHIVARFQSRGTGRSIYVLMVLVLFAALAVPAVSLVHAATIPTFSIVAVVTDTSVTIRTSNFPANQLFTVRMGAYGTQAVGGIIVGSTNSGAGGAFEETYAIPAALAGSYRIAIRMDSPGGYFAYNWFFNNTTGVVTPAPGTVVPPISGIPTFSIQAVVRDTTVTVSDQ